MHAYLLIGTVNDLQSTINDLADKLHAKILEFPLQKIDDVRSLNNLVRLSFDEPTLLVSKNIDEATEEALNAFLKNLEEPQENIYFALTAPGVKKVLPTIVSRCQIIKSTNKQIIKSTNEMAEKFLEMGVGEKLGYIETIKDRAVAVELIENTVNLLHSKIHENDVKYSVVAKNIELAVQTLTRLKANGNVNLHLTNFVINYAK